MGFLIKYQAVKGLFQEIKVKFYQLKILILVAIYIAHIKVTMHTPCACLANSSELNIRLTLVHAWGLNLTA